MKTLIVGLALVAGCAKGASSRAPMGAAPSTMAEPASAGAAAVAAGNPAVIATGEDSVRPAAGQLTAGVWDDNLNFNFFTAYAQRMAQQSGDLGAFSFADQRASMQQFAQLQGPHGELDVQLVLDTTGSMGDELKYLQSEFDAISKELRARYPQITPRWSLVVYKDRGDTYVTRPFDFTQDAIRFQRDLGAQSAGGGGDFPEAVIAGLDHGLAQHWRPDANVAKIIFWVADAPPHPDEGGALATLARRARDMGVHVYPIASSGIDDSTEYQMRATAQLTGGRYLFLTDDSRIGNGHAEPSIPCYAVTRLDHAILRVVDTELSGKRLPTPVDQVVRRVGSPTAQGTCTVNEMQVVAF
ncbi:MAG: vWA domain-containing protein [Kofleriaceae bacterium]